MADRQLIAIAWRQVVIAVACWAVAVGVVGTFGPSNNLMLVGLMVAVLAEWILEGFVYGSAVSKRARLGPLAILAQLLRLAMVFIGFEVLDPDIAGPRDRARGGGPFLAPSGTRDPAAGARWPATAVVRGGRQPSRPLD